MARTNQQADLKTDLNQWQRLILNKIIFLPKARFKDLKVGGLSTDHLSYHLRSLVHQGYLSKSTEGWYELTLLGKELISRFDTDQAQVEKQGKRGVLLRVIKREQGRDYYLVNKRLKQPFYGFIGFHTGKIRWGESVEQSARRELYEETGLTPVKWKMVGIFHLIDYLPNGELLRDIYFYAFNIYSFLGRLIKDNKKEGVANMWMTKKQLRQAKTYPGFWNKSPISWQFMRRQEKWPLGKIVFNEQEMVVEGY